MLPFYKGLCEQFKWAQDEELVRVLKEANDKKVEELAATIKDAEENLGESEVREGFLARAEYFCRIGDKVNTTIFAFVFTLSAFILQDKAVNAFQETTEKTVGLGQKLDIVFSLIRIGFFWNDHDLIERNIEKAKRCA